MTRTLRTIPTACAALALAAAVNAPAGDLPVADGLVLWLDAADAATLTLDDAGGVREWTSKCPGGLVARQPASEARPRPADDGEPPAVRFDSGDHLNLGRPDALALGPGRAFTMLVAYRLAAGGTGTFLARGGGPDAQRPWQFFAARSGRIGAVSRGGRAEGPTGARAGVATLVCDGERMDVFHDGRSIVGIRAGRQCGDGDVLLGARRDGADNAGLAYPLNGELAEVLVYDRKLPADRRAKIAAWLRRKHDLTATKARPARPGPKRRPRLDDAAMEAAAGRLDHPDPFVRGLAAWEITERVGQDNNGQEQAWPRKDPPAWYAAWASLPPSRVLEADYVRQAVDRGVGDDAASLRTAVNDAVRRARAVAAEIRAANRGGADLDRGLAALDAIGKQAAAADADDLAALRALYIAARLAAREIVLSNPAVDFDRLLFVKRYGPHTKRNITRPFPWKHKPGGDLCVLEGLAPGGDVRPLIAGRLGPGHVRGADLWWDADRAVFAFAAQPDWPPAVNSFLASNTMALRRTQPPMRLYEIDLTDGSAGAIRRLTDDPHWNDFEPTYCPDGGIVFASDRQGRAPECGSFGNDMTAFNLHRLEGDGTVRHLTDNKDYDRHPHCLDNGLVAYTRWEYQERHFMEIHSVWTVRPDGAMADTLFKHHLANPLALRDVRSVPGTERLIAVATGHHTFIYGALVLLDPAEGMNSPDAIRVVTPGVKPQEGRVNAPTVAAGGVRDKLGFYTSPWALSETCFLAAYAYHRPKCTANSGADTNGFGLYLIDVHGNKELIYRDPVMSCITPIPLRPRPRPPVVTATAEPDADEAVCYVPDVHEGADGIEPGSIRYIRIAQHLPWPFDPNAGKMPYLPDRAFKRQFGFWSWSPVRVIGTVPVEADGSAYFRVPANTAVYFQALDANRMELRRMRTMVALAPGERRSCNGCHETTATAPAAGPLPRALRKPPAAPDPPPWGADRALGYEWLIQPILDKHCTRCHATADGREPKGGLDFSAARGPGGFHRSFLTMFGGREAFAKARPVDPLVSIADRFDNSAVTRPKQFGSHRSRLIEVLRTDPRHRKNVQLSETEWRALVTWIDTNAPYHGGFINKRPADGGKPERVQWTTRNRR